MADYVRNIEEAIGAEAVKLIHEEAQNGRISIKTAEHLAAELGRKGEAVRGNFKRRTHTGNAIDGAEAMEILSDWWNHGNGCNERDPKQTVMRALEQVGLRVLFSKLCKLDQDVPKVVFIRPQGVDENHNRSSENFNEDHEDKVLISEPQRTSAYRRMNSMDRGESHWQKLKTSIRKRKHRKESTSRDSPSPMRWKKRWILEIAAVILLLFFCFWYFFSSAQTPFSTSTRSIRVGHAGEPSESVAEVHGCPTTQIDIPNLGTAIVGHTGIQISETRILVCGGTNDEGYDPRACLLLVLGIQQWLPFNHTMNEARIHAHSKVSDDKVFVIGGIDSHVIRNCKTSQDVFNLRHPEKGWQLEYLPSEEDSLCFPSEVILEIPCE